MSSVLTTNVLVIVYRSISHEAEIYNNTSKALYFNQLD